MVGFVRGRDPLVVTWKTGRHRESKGMKTELLQELTKPEASWRQPWVEQDQHLGGRGNVRLVA